MAWLVAIPLAVRLGVLFLLGTAAGSLANLAAYRWSWQPRSISPWSDPLPSAPPRRPRDRVPILGWLGLRREVAVHGRGFWIRPLLVELVCGLGFAALYWWEVVQHGLLPPFVPPGVVVPIEPLHATFVAHLILIWLMLVASLIDVDEKLIPDQVTVPGTLAGLILMAVLPSAVLPQVSGRAVALPGAWPLVWPNGQALLDNVGRPVWLEGLNLASPNSLPANLVGRPLVGGLLLGLACYAFWCFALIRRPWYPRHGLRRAVQILFARIAREATRTPVIVLGCVGAALVVAVWATGGPRWSALLSGLVGLAAAGAMVWAVRIIGTAALRREAMGFGDVLLMAMFGALLGWQACLIVFFLAPFAGLVVGVLQYVLHRDQEIPYGPFLCLGALATIVAWPGLWEQVRDVFRVGWLIPAVLAICLVLMAALLILMRAVREALFGRRA